MDRITRATNRVLQIGLALAVLMMLSAPAAAGWRLKERVYDDSYGNLIIVSPSGYKRIVVGKGYLAAQMERERIAEAGHVDGRKWRRHCHVPPVLWRGRSYMYGLADGEIPTPPVVCD